MPKVIITAPSLDPKQNVSGVSSVAKFIIDNNSGTEYVHFQLGKKDKDKGGWRRVFSILSAYKRWGRLLNQECDDTIIHYSFPLSAPSIIRDPLFMYRVLRKKMKMVVHVHGGLYLTKKRIPFVLNRILKWVFSWDVPFIVLSEGEKRTLIERFGANEVHVLPNCPQLPDKGEGCLIKGKDPLMGQPLTLGYLGRIEINKGMTELLGACMKLRKKGVPFRLYLAGKEQTEDEYLPEFDRQLGGMLHYAGVISGAKKDEFLRSLDVLVMPTYFEGLPVSLLECMAYGVVPVITPVGSIPDVVESWDESRKSNANGIFIKVKDEYTIVQAVTKLHEDRELLAHLSKNAIQTILNNFSTEKYVKNLNDIYASLLSDKR